MGDGAAQGGSCSSCRAPPLRPPRPPPRRRPPRCPRPRRCRRPAAQERRGAAERRLGRARARQASAAWTEPAARTRYVLSSLSITLEKMLRCPARLGGPACPGSICGRVWGVDAGAATLRHRCADGGGSTHRHRCRRRICHSRSARLCRCRCLLLLLGEAGRVGCHQLRREVSEHRSEMHAATAWRSASLARPRTSLQLTWVVLVRST
jgi:hypothetical protein